MALAALLQRHKAARVATLVTLGIFGAALFFGDGIITPAISVLGSVQGLKVAEPRLAHLVVPLSVVILSRLFFLQRRGSGTIGWLFGPVILVWFVAIGLLGLNQVLKDPAVLQALSPTWGARFLVDHGVGRIPDARRRRPRRHRRGGALRRPGSLRRRADPARLVCGRVPRPDAQLPRPGGPDPRRPEHRGQPLLPDGSRLGPVPDALPRNRGDDHRLPGGDLGFVLGCPAGGPARVPPAPHVLHPSKIEGQIYVPIVNWGLCIGVVTLALIFQSADKLGDIYGVAVTGTFILNTLLFVGGRPAALADSEAEARADRGRCS